MVVALYEEPKSRIDESRTIGHLRYKGLRPAPRGQGKVEFTFVLDEDGMLHVHAVVEGKQYDKSIKIGVGVPRAWYRRLARSLLRCGGGRT